MIYLVAWLPILSIHWLDNLGVVWSILDNVKQQFGPWLVHVTDHFHRLLCHTSGPEHTREEDNQYQQLHQGDVPVIASLKYQIEIKGCPKVVLTDNGSEFR